MRSRTARIKADGTADLFSYDPAGQVTAAAYGAAGTVAITAPRDEPKPNNNQSPVNPENPVKKEADPAFTAQQTFAYDAAGNRIKATDRDHTTEYKANENNQYTAISENGTQHEPDYDKSGNLLHDATRKFIWDADIHLLSVATQTEVNGQKSEVRESFRYDALHRRVARSESSTNTTTYFVHDGWNVIAEYAASPRLSVSSSPRLPQVRHIWSEDLSRTLQGAGGIGGLLSSTHFNWEPGTGNREPTKLFFSYDSNGNVILLTNTLCLTAAKYRYDAFGKTISATGSVANLNRYRFSSKPLELASELAFYGYRYYDPITGRWPSRDPATEIVGGIQLYTLAKNDPLNNFDPNGLLLCSIIGEGLEHLIKDLWDCAPGLRCEDCCDLKSVALAGIHGILAICSLAELEVDFGAGVVYELMETLETIGDNSDCKHKCHCPLT